MLQSGIVSSSNFCVLYGITNSFSPCRIKRNISPVSDSPNHFLSKYEALVPFGSTGAGGGLMRTDSMTSANGLLKPDENEIINLNKMDYEEYVSSYFLLYQNEIYVTVLYL